MKNFVLMFAVLVFIFSKGMFSHAKEAKILAIVDDGIISNLDLENRSILLKQMSVSGFRLEKDLLQHLIDEHLFLKYAKDFNVVVTDAEVGDVIQSLGIKTSNLDYDELFSQIKGKIIWNKMISQYIMPVTSVSGQEVDDYIKKFLSSKDAVNLVKRVQNEQGSWQEINIGWVDIKSLEPDLRAIIEKLGLNEVSSIYHDGGKATQFKVTDVENEHILKAYFKIRKLKNAPNHHSDEYCSAGVIEAKGSDFSPTLRENLLSIKEGQLSRVIKERVNNENSEYRIVLCGSSLKMDLHQYIFASKVEKEQKKYLATLRESSFIQIKA